MSMLEVLNGKKTEKGHTGLVCGESVTKQKVGMEHDINKIVAKYKRTGQMPSLKFNGNELMDGEEIIDLTQVGDYQTCVNRITYAREIFNEYPSVVRRYFNNDIESFVGFMSDIKNPEKLKEAIRLGLVEKIEEKKQEVKKVEPTKNVEVKNDGGEK